MQKALGVSVSALLVGLAFAGTAQADTVPQQQNTASRTAAAADNCNWAPDRSAGNVSMRTTKEIRLRYGPAASCGFIGWTDMDEDTRLWAVCKAVNSSGNTWYYVDPAESSWRNGWIYSGNVTVGSGSIPRC